MVNQTTRILLAIASAFVGLQLVGYFFPTSFTWGFHSFGFLPAWLFITAIAVALFAVIILSTADVVPFVRRLAGYFDAHPVLMLVLMIGSFAGLAIFFRIEAPLLGDGFFLVKNFSDAFHGTAPLYFRDEPIATVYFWIIFNIIGVPMTYTEFLHGFLIADLVLGVSFVVISYFTLKISIADPTARLLGSLLVLVLPSMQLFFGYVETYPVVLVALSSYILTAAICIRRDKYFTLAAIAFLLMALTHYMTVVLLPSLLFLAYREYRQRGLKAVLTGFGVLAAVFVGILVAINFDVSQYYSYVPHHHYLSLTQPTDPANAESQAYTLLSPFHVLDLANLLVLIALPALFLLFLAALKGTLHGIFGTDLKRFAAAALVPILLVLIVIKFDLGAARDWDVFASYAFLAILLAILLVSETTDQLTVRFWALAIILTLLQSVSYWSVNAKADATLARYEALLDTRTVSQGSYYTASLHRAQYYRQIKNDSLAIESWKRFNKLFPNDLRGYENLITGWTQGGHAKIEEMINTYEQWLSHTSNDTSLRIVYRNFCLNLGNAYFKQDDLGDAARFYGKAISIDSFYANAHNNLGSVYAQQGNIDHAITQYKQAIALNPMYGEAYYNLGNTYNDRGNKKLAHEYFQKAAQLNVAEAESLLQESKRSH
ncbi:MAG: tetratricopeptide repeat protein [Ignavibacteriae bacterium]|nr:tetratricopeptide repeat protein [Ignavibacteria bacterium]MBI3363793.1 tetratricopeptide repeat protein [Ignavibacteriota bacterium]